MVDIGELNQKISFIKLEKSEDSDGYPITSRKKVRTAWAKVSRVSGTEQVRAGADKLIEKIRFLIRWSPVAIDRKMIVNYRGNDYEIEFINDYEDMHNFEEIWCNRITQEE